MLVRRRFPGAIEFGRPARGSNSMMPLFIRSPVSGRTTRAPKLAISVVVIVTIVPSESQTVRCVVQLSCPAGSGASTLPASLAA